MIAAQEKKHTELETLWEEASAELERNAELMANVSQLYEELISYGPFYCHHETFPDEPHIEFVCARYGGEYRDRTGDLLHAMQALSQLS